MSDPIHVLRPPPCKSSFQRMLLLAWLAGGDSRIAWWGGEQSLPDDVSVLCDAMRRFGARVEHVAAELDRLDVASYGYPAHDGERRSLDLGMNGTALRTLTAIVGALGGDVDFGGAPGLSRRPLVDLALVLERRGAAFDFGLERGYVPFRLRAPAAQEPLLAEIDLHVTSQGASGLAIGIAASGFGGRLTCHGPLGYLRLTRAWLEEFGIEAAIEKRDPAVHEFTIGAGELRAPETLEVPGDPSSAAWMLALYAGLGRFAKVIGLAPCGHPDLAMVDHLRLLGYEVREEIGEMQLLGVPYPRSSGDYEPVGLEDAPDLFPPLVALLSIRPGRHVLRAAKLRHKESDRIAVLARGLDALGFEVYEEADSLVFTGREPGTLEPRDVTLDPADDHRMAMAFAIIARLHGVQPQILDRDCVAKSWPGFWQFLEGC